MNDSLKKNEKYYKRYMKRHRMLCVCLDKEKDKDIVSWIEKQENISASVKQALRSNIGYCEAAKI